MKKTKKLAALFLAMVMALSLTAMTAAAAGTEEHEHTDACSAETIQPRRPEMECSTCGAEMSIVGTELINGVRHVTFGCPYGHGTRTIIW